MRKIKKIILTEMVLVVLMLYYLTKSKDLGLLRLFSGKFDASVEFIIAGCIIFTIFFSLLLFDVFDKIQISVFVGDKQIGVRNRIVKSMIYYTLSILCFAEVVWLFFEYQDELSIYTIRTMINNEKAIVHGCGTIEDNDGNSYAVTNTYEALLNCYANNNRISEMDFMVTSDKKLVCGHDGDDGWAYGIDGKQPLTEKIFLNGKFLGKFTTIGLDDLAHFMFENDDFYVITDIKTGNKEGCECIATNYPELRERFIIQIYHIDEYNMVKDMGFNNIIYTLYGARAYEREPDFLVKNIGEYNLVGVTLPIEWSKDAEWFDPIFESDVPIYVHTVNKKNEIEDVLNRGISAVYTDNTDNNWMR